MYATKGAARMVFNLFTLENFVLTGPATLEFKNFAQENGFVIDYRNSIDGFLR